MPITSFEVGYRKSSNDDCTLSEKVKRYASFDPRVGCDLDLKIYQVFSALLLAL